MNYKIIKKEIEAWDELHSRFRYNTKYKSTKRKIEIDSKVIKNKAGAWEISDRLEEIPLKIYLEEKIDKKRKASLSLTLIHKKVAPDIQERIERYIVSQIEKIVEQGGVYF